MGLPLTSETAKMLTFWVKIRLKHDFSDKPYVSNLFKGLESVKVLNGEREKVRGSRFAERCVLDAVTFDLGKSKYVDFLGENAIKTWILKQLNVGNLSEGLKSVNESIEERERVRGSRSAKRCVLDALILTLKTAKNIFLWKCSKTWLDKPIVGTLSNGLESVNKSIGERKKVRGSKYARRYVLDAWTLDLKNSKKIIFLCVKIG